MKTFALVNGDIVLGKSDGYQMVTGGEKLRQDLSVSMREPFGCDRFHPKWGSQLINYIGSPVSDATSMLVKAEIGRLLQNYLSIQKEVMQGDAALGRKSRFGPGEVISQVNKVDVRQQYDSYQVKVTLTTLSGQTFSIVQTVQQG